MIDTWFGDPDAPTLGFLHVPEGGSARGGVVICPPLGYEQFNSYRAMRFLGQELATQGIAALRFDYLGEGDASGASAEPDAVERWLATIESAVAYLRSSGVDRIAVVGLASGALLAEAALERLTDVVAVVHWDPALSGRRFLRRQRSLHEITVGPSHGPDDGRVSLLAGVLHADVARWLDAREISAASLAAHPIDTLVLTRLSAETTVSVEKLRHAAAPHVTVQSIDGQERLLDVQSAIAEVPVAAIATITDWLDDRFPATATPVTPTVTTVATVATTEDGRQIVERLGRFGPQRLFTIETVALGVEPAAVVVMQPAAAEHRAAAGRFQVRAARELAERGYRAIRFDRRITGDSTEVVPGEKSLVLAEEWVDDARQLVDSLADGQTVALVGVCSGAWVAGRIAEQSRARLTVLVGPNYFRTVGLPPDVYADRVRDSDGGGSPMITLKTKLRDAAPGWLWRAVARLQVFNDPATLLRAIVRARGTVALLLSPEDAELFDHNRGPSAVARLRAGGADIRIAEFPVGDHALLGEEVQELALREILALADSTLRGERAVAAATGGTTQPVRAGHNA